MKTSRVLMMATACTLIVAGCGGAAAPAESVASTSPASSPKAPAGAVPAQPSQSAASSAPAKPAASASASQGSAGIRLTVSFPEISGDALPAWVAQDEGIFKKNGLDVDLRLIESAPGMAALLAGDTEIALIGGSEVVGADVGGAGVKVAAVIDPYYPYLFEAAKGVNSAADLNGKKIGVSKFGSSSDTATRIVLQKVGIDPDKDVTIIQVGSAAARTAAVVGGAIQGAIAHPPENLKMEQAGFHVLFDLTSLGLPNDNLSVNAKASWIAGHRDTMQKFVDSIAEAMTFMKQDKASTLKVVAKYYKSDDAQLNEATYDFHVNRIFKELVPPKPEQFTGIITTLAARNPKAKGFDASTILDASFVNSAVSRGLGPK